MSQTKAQLLSGTSAQDLTVDNISAASFNEGGLANKNLFINGACNIAQRNTSDTSDVQGYTTVDRFKIGWGGADAIIETHQASLTSSDTGPWAEGFRKAYKLVNGNQSSGAGAADYAEIQSKLEAQDMATSGWNYTSTSDYVTLSFWIKSSVAQNFYGFINTSDGTAQSYIFETGSLTADTWTKITKTLPGAAALQFDFDNGEGLIIKWVPFYGSNYTSSPSLNTWAAYSSSARTPASTSTWWTTNDATFFLTGVQLELGDTASSFDHKTIAADLSMCERYFTSSYKPGHVPSTSTSANGTLNVLSWGDGNAMGIAFRKPMRASPTVTLRSALSTTANRVNSAGTERVASAQNIGTTQFQYIDVRSGSATNWVNFGYFADAEL